MQAFSNTCTQFLTGQTCALAVVPLGMVVLLPRADLAGNPWHGALGVPDNAFPFCRAHVPCAAIVRYLQHTYREEVDTLAEGSASTSTSTSEASPSNTNSDTTA